MSSEMVDQHLVKSYSVWSSSKRDSSLSTYHALLSPLETILQHKPRQKPLCHCLQDRMASLMMQNEAFLDLVVL